jgi:P27 family predicted phage terminase small subunit
VAATRKPAGWKVLSGNPGNRDDAAPATGRPLPQPPADLDAHGRDEWQRIIAAAGPRLGPEDYSTMVRHCRAWEQYLRAIADIKDRGDITYNSRGDGVRNPSYQIITDAQKVMDAGAARFGLSPRDRQNLGVGAPDPDADRDPFAA